MTIDDFRADLVVAWDEPRGGRAREDHYRAAARAAGGTDHVRHLWHLVLAELTSDAGVPTPRADRCRIRLMTAQNPDRVLLVERGTGREVLAKEYMAVCLHCDDYEGLVRDSRNEAIEDAHDHVFPGWREVPIVECLPSEKRHDRRAATAWERRIRRIYPAGWFERGGPIVTLRTPGLTRHVPGAAPGGGYDMARFPSHPASRSTRTESSGDIAAGADGQTGLF